MTMRGELSLCTFSIVLLTAALLTPSDSQPHLAVTVILSLIAVSSAISVYVHYGTANIAQKAQSSCKNARSGRDVELAGDDANSETRTELLKRSLDGLRPSLFTAIFIFAPGVALTILLLVRLIGGVNHFGGEAILLDFGPKYGMSGDNADPNVAFVNEFNSYGHCIQGVLASFLAYPAVVGAVARLSDCSSSLVSTRPKHVCTITLFELFSSIMTIYPMYNFIKRVLKDGDTFATTSFMNNGMEWAMGCILGLSFGMMVTALIVRRLVSAASPSKLLYGDDDNQALAYGKSEDYNGISPLISKSVKGFRSVLGVLFVLCMFLSAILMGYTWNKCSEGGVDCDNYVEGGSPVGIMIGLGAIPIIVYVATVVLYRRR